jgi:predicted esterase
MKPILLLLSSSLLALSSPTDDFIAQATEKHGPFGEKAARFLLEHMPETDKESLTTAFLLENLDLALQARTSFPWAKDIPEEIFLNDVLPYAVFDEPRDPWRAYFLEKATPLVKDAKTASEATQILNRDLFKLIKTHYNTERKRTNQSPKESIEQGKATCTGLSIILVAACRSVGIPARAAGTPMWHDKSGNHTWVEIWDKNWHFTGADEFDQKGLNHAWFTEYASKADDSQPAHSIYATSWKKDQGIFPMVWAPTNKSVGGENITGSYRKIITGGLRIGAGLLALDGIQVTIGIRFFEKDQRIAKQGTLTTAAGTPITDFLTKAGTADLNDTPRVNVKSQKSYRLRFDIDGKPHETKPFQPTETILDIRATDLTPVPNLTDDNTPLTKDLATRAVQLTYETLLAEQKEKRAAELEAKSITIGQHTMKWMDKTYGDEPADGRSLWISMHGGGEAPHEVNEGQWHNQIKLYQPKEGIYLAPRAPTNTWNMWHQDHIDPLFSRLIENMVALKNVNPNKIYLMGYSAGGDGVWQLAPRIADQFAAASMMAGHPNEAQLFGLRNLPFGIFMGANDAAVNRNKVAIEKSAEILALQKADPEGYTHMSRIYEGLGHWMKLKDAEAVPWMATFTRNPWPKKIVWYQDDVTHDRFYWLEIPAGTAEKDKTITANLKDRTFRIEGDVPAGTKLLLSDSLLDLDQPITISVNDLPPFQTTPVRKPSTIREALNKRLDPASTPTASIPVHKP